MDTYTAKVVETAEETKGSGLSCDRNRKKRLILLGGSEMVEGRGFRKRGRTVRMMMGQKGPLIGGWRRRSRRGNRIIRLNKKLSGGGDTGIVVIRWIREDKGRSWIEIGRDAGAFFSDLDFWFLLMHYIWRNLRIENQFSQILFFLYNVLLEMWNGLLC